MLQCLLMAHWSLRTILCVVVLISHFLLKIFYKPLLLWLNPAPFYVLTVLMCSFLFGGCASIIISILLLALEQDLFPFSGVGCAIFNGTTMFSVVVIALLRRIIVSSYQEQRNIISLLKTKSDPAIKSDGNYRNDLPALIREQVDDCGREEPAQKKVLVVDDNKDAAHSLARVLKSSGHQAKTVYDGMSALAMAKQEDFDVVLLDIGLPILDGYEVCRRLRSGIVGSNTTIIAVTGYGNDAAKKKSQQEGFNYHLVKPVDPNKLVQLVNRDWRIVRGSSKS